MMNPWIVLKNALKLHHLKFKRGREIKSGDTISGEWFVSGSEKNHLALIHEMLQDPEVTRFEY